jgi:hypothetical protein
MSVSDQEAGMSIAKQLKKIPFLYRANAAVKARLQESRAADELVYYQNKLPKAGMKLPEGESLVQALRKRLSERGIHPNPKNMGTLHIFLVYLLYNWEAILPIALKPFGQVSEFEWCSRGFDDKLTNWPKRYEAMNSAMIETFRQVHRDQPVDAVVGYLSGATTDPVILMEMANSGAVIFNFSWDDKLHFAEPLKNGLSRGPGVLASSIDLNLTNAPDSRVKYIVQGGLAMFWPEAAHPEVHRPHNLPLEFDVSFVGQKYGWRPRFIKRLRKMGINVTCFGNGWENGPLSDEDMVKLYSRSRINLGFAGVGHSKKLMCLKGRDFEVPMSGGLYLTQDNPELSLVYDVGKEIVTYKDEKDCAQKIRWLLAHPDEADNIRNAGRTRAMKDHSWEKRFEQVFGIAGILK